MGRPPCCDKSNVKRGLWTPEEDAKILAYVSNHGIGNWTLVPKKAGLNRCGKSCRLRWTNYLRPDLKHDNFTPQEEELIIDLHAAVGSRWSLIAKRLPGRTDNDVKNYWNTKLRKKLMKMGIDPVTHKPVTQVLSDLGSISGFPNTNTTNNNQIVLVNKDMMSNMLPSITEPHASVITSDEGVDNHPKLDQMQVENVHHSWEHHVVLQPHVFNEGVSSSSSSSSLSSPSTSNLTQLSSPQNFSCQNPQAQIITPACSSFDWSEFLHNDPFVWSEFQQLQQCDLQRVVSSLNTNSIENDVSGAVACDASMVNNKKCEGNSASGDSFVDDILDKDSKIRAAFPELLDASFDF